MIRVIVLDSGPLGLITHRSGVRTADDCRRWLAAQSDTGARIILPEIVDYELRRELLRLNKVQALERLDSLIEFPSIEYHPITTQVMRRAAELWAETRKLGLPTADPHALDVDVILAAQSLSVGVPKDELVVATANVGHLNQFLPAKLWSTI